MMYGIIMNYVASPNPKGAGRRTTRTTRTTWLQPPSRAERPHPPIPQQLSAAASEACIPLAGLLPCAVARAHPLYIIQSHAMLDVNYIQM